MRFVFQNSTGKIVFKRSPKLQLTEEEVEKVHSFAANQWEDVPEIDGDHEELVFWFERKPKDFQKYLDEIATGTGVKLPDISQWN